MYCSVAGSSTVCDLIHPSTLSVCALENPFSFHWIVFSSFLLVGTFDVGKTRLMFWDLGGQEELQSLWDKVGDVVFSFGLFHNYRMMIL